MLSAFNFDTDFKKCDAISNKIYDVIMTSRDFVRIQILSVPFNYQSWYKCINKIQLLSSPDMGNIERLTRSHMDVFKARRELMLS